MTTDIVLIGKQKPEGPCTTCMVVQPTKNRRTVNDEETYSEIKSDHAHIPSGKGPEVQPKDEDVTLGSGLKQTPGVTFDRASHTNKPEVRNGFLFNNQTVLLLLRLSEIFFLVLTCEHWTSSLISGSFSSAVTGSKQNNRIADSRSDSCSRSDPQGQCEVDN